MGVAIVTGSASLIGSEAVRHFVEQGMIVVGIDNDVLESFTSPGLTRTRVVPILTTPPPGMPMALRRVRSALAKGSEPRHGSDGRALEGALSGDLIEDR